MDATWYKDVNRFAVHTAWLHGFMKAYAVDGVAVFGLLVLAAWWFSRTQANPPRAVAASIWAAAGTLIAVALNQIFVHAVARPRPYIKLHNVEVLVSRSTDYSFPSDHAVTAGAAVAGLWVIAHYSGRVTRVLAAVGTILALLLAFARVYVGAHYPGDVAAGLVIGAAISVVGWLALKAFLTAVVERIGNTGPLRPFVFSRPAGEGAADEPGNRRERVATSPSTSNPGGEAQL